MTIPGGTAQTPDSGAPATAGPPASEVTMDNPQPADALAAFAPGQADAWGAWSPCVEQAVAQDHTRILADGFAAARLIPQKPDMTHFAVCTYNDTVPNS